MPERNALLDCMTIWITLLRFAEPSDDPPEMLAARIFIDFALMLLGVLQLCQTVQRGREAGKYENAIFSVYLLLMLDALAADCRALTMHRGWEA